MRKEGGREGGIRWVLVPEHGDRCSFVVLFWRRLFFGVFPFPPSYAKLIGDVVCTSSAPYACSWEHRLLIMLYLAETEIHHRGDGGKIKSQIKYHYHYLAIAIFSTLLGSHYRLPLKTQKARTIEQMYIEVIEGNEKKKKTIYIYTVLNCSNK